jgi:predicted anti-sigma-YlaC factor YlaD
MDHRYIDENGVAERYLEHALAPEEHDVFESHLVDCEECTDRLLLAQIFLDHRALGHKAAAEAAPAQPLPPVESSSLPMRAQFVARMSPWQLLLLAVVAALLLLAVPTAYFFRELARLSGLR